MSETITLPKSGVVLTGRGFKFLVSSSCWRAWLRDDPAEFGPVHSKGLWTVWLNGLTAHVGTREECITWLDARVLETRAALLSGTRETIAHALCESSCGPGVTWEDYDSDSHRSWLEQADAVLAALGGAS